MRIPAHNRAKALPSWSGRQAGPGAQNRGFSLIEVMCAILILGIALVGLVQGTTSALLSTKESELQTGAALIAAGVIETLRAEGDLVDGETEGDGGAALPLYRWRRTLRPAGTPGLHEVDVVVEHAKTGKEIYELQTLLFEPADETANGAPKRSRESGSKRKRGGQS